MPKSELGKRYSDHEAIIRQGEPGDCMYVILSGTVEVLHERDGKPVKLAELGEGDFFGEMSLFAGDARSATVRSLGDTRILTVDRRTLLSRIQADPSLALRILERMSTRIKELDEKFSSLRSREERS